MKRVIALVAVISIYIPVFVLEYPLILFFNLKLVFWAVDRW